MTLIIDRLNGSEKVIETAINTENSSSSSSDLEWVYLKNTYLSKGKYAIRLMPNAQTDLDLFAMYSENEPSRAMNLGEPKNILSSREGDPPAYLSNYSKVSPTKYALEIKNATRPFVLSLAESYDQLWTAHTSEIQNSVNKQGKENYEFKTNSIPLFSIINGFQINKTGSYSLTIEYEPQDWFFKGATVSAIMIVLLLSMVIAYYIIRRIKISDRIKRRLDLR